MFFEFERHFDVADYNHKGLLRTDSILKIFQEAAINHSANIGYSTQSYMGSGNIWMHNKNLFKADVLPNFRQKLKIKTWSRGIEKFKGFRNYEIYADGEKCVTGSSVWIYLNIEKRRPVRPSQEMVDNYDSEDVPVFSDRVKKINIQQPSADADEVVIKIRPSDFDVNGHVSNVTYGQYFETVLSDYDFDVTGKYFSIAYQSEIKTSAKEVAVRYEKIDSAYRLGVYSDGVCNCIGEVSYE
ncbi:MAG: hypothetical protein C0602_13235 [Denitrovibrio sp.]|nr:MAG: hypothetical protein C0602_13235 [Denitrovibrio sp.]